MAKRSLLLLRSSLGLWLGLGLLGLLGLVGCASPDDALPAAASFEILPPSEAFLAFTQDMQALGPSVFPSGHGHGYVPPPVVIPGSAAAQDQSILPTVFFDGHYDLRGRGKLSPVRDQGSCGSCWTFATYAQAESSLRPGESWDFAEEHLNNAHGFDVAPCLGGNAFMSIAYLSRWDGPVAESDAPYTGAAQTFAQAPAARKHLREALLLPDRAGPDDNGGLKSAILTYGAVYTSMSWRDAAYSAAKHSYYNRGPASSTNSANHAVAIVGWDDDFAADRFAPAAPGPGAFIVRNSWGEGFGEDGYFYASYHDAFIGKDNAVFSSFGDVTDYRRIYQHDRLGFTAAAGYAGPTSFSAAVFTATEDSSLRAVSFYSTTPGVTFDVSVYDAPAAGSPVGAPLVATQQGTERFAGYHQVALATPVALHAGRRFSVVVRQHVRDATVSYLALEYPLAGFSSQVTAVAGTSFISADGLDWYDTGKKAAANVPIKAFAGPSQEAR